MKAIHIDIEHFYDVYIASSINTRADGRILESYYVSDLHNCLEFSQSSCLDEAMLTRKKCPTALEIQSGECSG